MIPIFQSTLLMRGATPDAEKSEAEKPVFQSTLLMRGATKGIAAGLGNIQFQSTLLMRGATTLVFKDFIVLLISIHAPHARSDLILYDVITHLDISIHAPHARSDRPAAV